MVPIPKQRLEIVNETDFFAEIRTKGLDLTEQQKRAVVHDRGPLLLLAVPGAGKTTVLTVRLAYLILVKGIDPTRILCLTFGRAAAKEMRERFVANFGAIPVQFSTIHSFAYEILRTTFRQNGIEFQLLEEQTGAESKTGVLRRIYEKHNASPLSDEQLEGLQNAICYVKNTLSRPADLLECGIKNFPLIYEDYENYKRSSRTRLLDYDDMLSLAFQILQEQPTVLEHYRRRFDYLLTDESQDTSLLQHKIIEVVVQPGNNLFVVGDDDQSIFGFRAAEPNYLLEFEQIYPGAKILRMEQNFRSTPQIVNTACGFIRSNQLRYDKAMFTGNPQEGFLQSREFAGIQEQHEFIIRQLKREKDLGRVGILYRNNLSAICLADALDRADIPFYMRESGKQRFFSHWVVNDVLNFLRFSFNDKSLTVLERIWSKLNCPIRKQQLDLLKQMSLDRSIFDILAEQPGVTAKGKIEYLDLKNWFKELNSLSPAKAIPYIRSRLDYDQAVKRICESLGFSEDYVASLLDILEVIARQEATLVDFARRLTYLEQQMLTSYKNKHGQAVTLSTIHSAKGMEWEQVYLIDLVEGILPEWETIRAEQGGKNHLLEEERRLFYVGMTRAKRELTLCSLNYYHGKRVKSSRFLREVRLVRRGKVPQEVIESIAQEVSSSLKDLVPGLAVEHKAFGEGVIAKEEGNVLVVRFKDGSQRSFMKDICTKQRLIWAI